MKNDDKYVHIPIEIEINGKLFHEVVVDAAHIYGRHGDHVDEKIVMEIIFNMRGLEAIPAVTKNGSEFYSIHIQADQKDGRPCWYRVRFKLDDEIFIRTVHRDRDFKPERIKDDD